jgi:Holliday junction DNA helicase RuvA
MIEYIRGQVAELTPTTAIIDCNGVGYELNISLNTFAAVQGKESVKLFVYEAIREDAHILYGFITKAERELFLLLITVSGIGGSTARMILSAFSPRELSEVILQGNDSLLKGVKGIGLKTAQRIIVDLKDKIPAIEGGVFIGDIQQTTLLPDDVKEVMDESITALTMLGFQQSAATKAVRTVIKEQPDLDISQVIKAALKIIK